MGAMTRFSLFGIPITIQPFFWVAMAILGYLGNQGGGDNLLMLVAVFMIAGFLSILIHELGHYFGMSEDEIMDIEERYWRGEPEPEVMVALVVAIEGPRHGGIGPELGLGLGLGKTAGLGPPQGGRW